jgi:dipeptidase D
MPQDTSPPVQNRFPLANAVLAPWISYVQTGEYVSMTSQESTACLENLEPQAVWRFFAGMAAVPRESKHEEKIRAHTLALAKELGLTAREDPVGNIVIEVPASKGCEGAPIVVLQGHLDMVCEKNAGTEHDFANDPIKLILDEDPKEKLQFLRADRTTLGADNGVGVALALAAATDPDVVHGPLEILCTIDEEAGMTGAKVLQPDFFKGKILLNLDSEEDDALYIGCAGGCDSTLTYDFPLEPVGPDMEVVRLTVDGLRGGHSGCDIHENRGSAIKLLVTTILRAQQPDVRIVTLGGGSKRNAIPREAHAVLAGPDGFSAGLRSAAETVARESALASQEPAVAIRVETAKASDADAALTIEDTGQLLASLAALPHGVLDMHPSIPGLVQTSNNVAIIRADASGDRSTMRIAIETLSRSSSDVWIKAVLSQIGAVGYLSGALVETGNDYPGWEPDVDSKVLRVCRDLYEKLFAERPHVTAIHAGLECGIIGQRMGKMDMISFGPRIEGAHSPDERVYVESVQKTWKFLKAVLAELAKA